MNGQEYPEFLKKRAIPDYEETDGNKGVYILHRLDGEEAHFLMPTFWESLDVIKNFAGADISQANIYPEASQYLLEFEPTIQRQNEIVR